MKAKIIKACVFPKGIKQDDFDLWYKTNDNIPWIEKAMEAYVEQENKRLRDILKADRQTLIEKDAEIKELKEALKWSMQFHPPEEELSYDEWKKHKSINKLLHKQQ